MLGHRTITEHQQRWEQSRYENCSGERRTVEARPRLTSASRILNLSGGGRDQLGFRRWPRHFFGAFELSGADGSGQNTGGYWSRKAGRRR